MDVKIRREIEVFKIYKSITIGMFIFLALYFLLIPASLPQSARNALLLFFLTISLWVSGRFTSSYIAVLAVASQPILGIQSAEEAFLGFFKFTILFIMGCFLMGSAIEKSGLSDRFVKWIIKRFKGNVKLILLSFIFLAGFLTWSISEHAVVVMLIPTIVKLLDQIKTKVSVSNLGKALIIGTAFAAATGGVATPAGGAANIMAIYYLNTFFGIKFKFSEWVVAVAPLVIIMLFAIWAILILLFPPEVSQLEIEIDSCESRSLSLKEIEALAILFLAIFMWVFYANVIPIALTAIFCGFLAILLRITTWRNAMRGKYGILLLYGGALSLGDALKNTGASSWLANLLLSHIDVYIPILLVFGVMSVSLLLTTSISDTTTVTVMGPIVMSLASRFAFNPKIFALMTAVPAGLGYVMPESKTSTIIAYETGYVSRRDIAKSGLLVNLVAICLLVVFTYTWWSWLDII